jgi:exosortase
VWLREKHISVQCTSEKNQNADNKVMKWNILIIIFIELCLAFLPYSFGYDDDRVPIAWFLQNGWKQEQWQHCWMVLPLFAFLVYQLRHELAVVKPTGNSLGLVAFIFSLVVYYIGFRVDNVQLGILALLLAPPTLTLWLAGRNALAILAFPFLFLFFAWPVGFLESAITFPLRVMMSHAAVFSLDFIGIDVVRNGTGILSAPEPLLGIPAGKKFAVDVADPCSGIRSLFALMMASALYGHFKLQTWWQKWVLFLCSAPLAIAGNLARILMLTIGTIVFGAEFAIGKNALTEPSWFHLIAGYLVFIVAIGGMIGISHLLLDFSAVRARLTQSVKSLRGLKPTSTGQSPPPPPGPLQQKKEDEY